ncbi:MAG: ATP-grasp domain-containing protein [Candidatus Stahlbacteria bacterium]|nr:ATP-grasp domain-containing protein [Candidatus Stahlbacteria bacterium]
MIGAIVIGGDYQGLGIIRSLGQHRIPICLLDSGPSIARVSKFTTKSFIYSPGEGEQRLADFLLSLAKKEQIEGWIIYPTTDEQVKELSIHRNILSQYYRVPTPKWEITQLLHNKKLTYKLAGKLNILVPTTFYPQSIEEVRDLSLQFPVILKPAVRGIFYKKTKRKALLAKNIDELIDRYRFAATIIPQDEIMIQEIIRGNLYSFCSLFKNKVPFAKLMAQRVRQHPMDFGKASTYVRTVDIPELEELGTKILQSVDYYGLSEVEFIWDSRDKQYKLLDVNARTWGWHTIGNQIELDFSFLLYKDLIDGKISIPFTRKCKMSRFLRDPDVAGQEARWVRGLTDTPVAIKEILAGRLKLSKYLESLYGKKEYAVWFLKDPLPFLFEFLLLPYLARTRGY